MTDRVVTCSIGVPQSRADFAGDGDAPLRVLLMQLTMRPENFSIGTIGLVQWRSPAGIFTNQFNATWNFIEPLGRCCTPAGECVITDLGGCTFYNGFWLGCDSCSPCEASCSGDILPLPGDGFVNVDDLLYVINHWGPCTFGPPCHADVQPNFHVNVDDLLVVINSWGQCRP